MTVPPRRQGRVLAAAALTLAAALHAAPPAQAETPAWSLQARQRLQGVAAPGADDQALDTRRQRLAEGERLLALGDAAAALRVFEQAAMMLHAADTEAALVRSHMQAGDYRRAIAFGAHAAGAHRREWPAGTALYGWLLQAGGQGVVARRQLDDALALAPDDEALQAARAQLAAPWPVAAGPLHRLPLQIAPYAWGTAVPAGAQVVGSAVLVGGGTAALLPAAALPASAGSNGPVWLRNGLGQTVLAHLAARDDDLGLLLLALATPLPTAELRPVAAAPFGGSPGYLVEYSPRDGAAAWPLLRHGFFARITAHGPRALGIEAPAGPRGGPVFDAAGRLAGIAVPGAGSGGHGVGGPDRLVPTQALLARFGPQLVAAPAAADGGAAPLKPVADVDEVYERSLRTALQVLSLR